MADDPRSLVGKPVVVDNPHERAAWAGIVIAYTDQPSVLIEQENGSRLMLPAAWARLTPASPTEGNHRD